MGNRRKTILSKLPATHQTQPNKKFFNATFDQLLSERNSSVINGYIGRRVGGQYDPKNDYYVSQPFRVRNNYALEPISVSKDPDSLDNTNEFFYEDIVNFIKYYNGDVSNHDRLFNSKHYSWAPPIDIDKFINYQNYYWINDDWPIIELRQIDDHEIENEIIGSKNYAYNFSETIEIPDPWGDTLDVSAYYFTSVIQITNITTSYVYDQDDFEVNVSEGEITFNNNIPSPNDQIEIEFFGFNLETGFIVEFPDADNYNEAYYINNVGCESGIQLLTWNEDTTYSVFPNQDWENIPWDDSSAPWDTTPWDSIRPNIENDYLTISRGSCDNNPWSRTNFWFHIETIRKAFSITKQTITVDRITRAERPIIEFKNCLELYGFGSKFIGSVDFATNQLYGDVINASQPDASMDGIKLADGDTFIFLNPEEPFRLFEEWDSVVWDCEPWDYTIDLSDDYNTAIWKATFDNGKIKLSIEKMAHEGDTVLVKRGLERFGKSYYVKNNRWVESEGDKLSENQAPLFMLYDCNGVPLDDVDKYPNSNFRGNKIFGYKINEFSPIIDPILNIPLSYRSAGSTSEIEFNNFIETERYRYITNESSLRIGGYYYYNCKKDRDELIEEDPSSSIYNEDSTNLSKGSFVVSTIGNTLVTTDEDSLYVYEKENSEWALKFTEEVGSGFTINHFTSGDTPRNPITLSPDGLYIAIAVTNALSSPAVIFYQKVGATWNTNGSVTAPSTNNHDNYGKNTVLTYDDGRLTAIVSNHSSGLQNTYVYRFDCESGWTLEETLTSGGRDLAYDQDRNRLYITDPSNNTVTIYQYDFGSAQYFIFNILNINNATFVDYNTLSDLIIISDDELGNIYTIDNDGNTHLTNISPTVSKMIDLSSEGQYLVFSIDDSTSSTKVRIYEWTNTNEWDFIKQFEDTSSSAYGNSVQINPNELFISDSEYIDENDEETGIIYIHRVFDECDKLDHFLNTWLPADDTAKQRVIDRYVVEDSDISTYEISVLPLYNDGFDVIAYHNGTKLLIDDQYEVHNDKVGILIPLEKNDVLEFFSYSTINCYEQFTMGDNHYFYLSKEPQYKKDVDIYVNNTSVSGSEFKIDFKTLKFNKNFTLNQGDEIEIHYQSSDNLVNEARGYYQIPSSLEKNPAYEEVTTHTFNDFSEHFLSIINNQPDQVDTVNLSDDNVYRNSCKDNTLGTKIRKHESSMLKSMLVASDDKLNIIEAIRLSQKEYGRYKNKFLSIAGQMKKNFELTGDVVEDFNEIIKRLVNTLETKNTFLNTYMFPYGDVLTQVNLSFSDNTITLPRNVDASKEENSTYLTAVGNNNNIIRLFQGVDYTIEKAGESGESFLTRIKISDEVKQNIDSSIYDNIILNEFSNIPNTHMPATPSKLGMWGISIPRIITDNTYDTPIDPSNMNSFVLGHDGSKTPVFNDERDELLLELESRIYNNINPSLLNKKCHLTLHDVKPGKFRDTNWLKEEFEKVLGSGFYKWCHYYNVDWQQNSYFDNDDGFTYNYRDHGVFEENVSGYWRGIYDYYYDTETPHLTPWEMLGFSDKPTWWEEEYGSDYSSNNTDMWDDIEAGYVRRGPREGTHEKFMRPDLVANFLPVGSSHGVLRTPIDIGIVTEPPLDLDKERDFVFGDGSPVESLWKMSSDYAFSVIETLYLTKPALFSEWFWNPINRKETPISDDYYKDDGLCREEKFDEHYVHGEQVNGEVIYRSGYQHWVSDRLSFLNQNITNTFGEKVRQLNVKLGNKIGGFTNKERLKAYFNSTNLMSESTSDLIPTENIDIKLYQSPTIDTHTYSGVVIRAMENGTYKVYGYDLLNPEFKIHPRSDASNKQQITVGGKSANFRVFEFGQTYSINEIVKYNNVFYRSLVNQTANRFDPNSWQRLPELPRVGGISVVYKPIPNTNKETSIPYGTTIDSPQEVFDFLIGYGDWLESNGWKFEQLDKESKNILNWKQSGREFLFWVNQNWEPDEVIKLSPAASEVNIKVRRGYPTKVEKESNGIYSLLNSDGIVVDPKFTAIDRDQRMVKIKPKFRENNFYFSKIGTKETEHIIIFDNITSFNDVIYSPLFATRQSRLRTRMIRTNDWIGKYEAEGYILDDNDEIKANIENTTNSTRLYHDRNDFVDNGDKQDAARHLIGFDEKSYLDNLRLDEDVQFLFYSGMIREKGTQQSIKKLLRSIYVQQEQDISVLNEWALKIADYGGTAHNISIDFKIKPEDIKTDPQLITLDTPQSNESFISEIKIVSSQSIWDEVPTVIIEKNPTDPNINDISDASAIAILNEDGVVENIDVIDNGSGYTIPPNVFLQGSAISSGTDTLYPLLNKNITFDDPDDDIIHLDVDDDERWVIKPRETTKNDLWPTTNDTNYIIPNAGYVLENEVDHMLFDDSDFDSILQNKETKTESRIWIAKASNRSWSVYRQTNIPSPFRLDRDENGTFLRSLDELPITSIGNLFDNEKLILGDIRNTDGDPIDVYVKIKNYKVDPSLGLFDHEYEIEVQDEDIDIDFELGVAYFNTEHFMKLRYTNKSERNVLLTTLHNSTNNVCLSGSQLSYIDDDGDNKWVVQEIDSKDVCSLDDAEWIDVRRQEPLVDSHKFKNAYMYDFEKSNTIERLPIFDPFKGIIAGPAKQNLDFITENDPARYTNSDEDRLINEDRIFTEKDVGKLWWDLSSARVLYYEQSDIRHRKNNWGRFFDGSDIAVYEWIESLTPPSEYNGNGEPKSGNSYVALPGYDYNRNRELTYYYFWVRGINENRSNRRNRTLSCQAVENFIRNPKSQRYRWFCPIKSHKDENRKDIQQIENLNSLMIANYSDIASNKETGLQINYRFSEEKQPNHSEWYLIKENDNRNSVLESIWNKVIDSLVGLTKPITTTDGIAGRIPTGNTDEYYLMVPDPSLSEAEKYGTLNRPRQSWFMDNQAAKKTAIKKLNELLSDTIIRDLYPGCTSSFQVDCPPSMFDLIGSSNIWNYTGWYREGFGPQNTKPSIKSFTLSNIDVTEISEGDIILITNSNFSQNDTGNATFNDSYYVYENGNFILVHKPNHRFVIKDDVWQRKLSLEESDELRKILEILIFEVLPSIDNIKLNEFFFSMTNYAFSEQGNLDWIFKTTYVVLDQIGITPTQDPLLQNDPIPNIIDYINSVKPYHTKIRDFTNNVTFEDEAFLDAEDEVTKKISMRFDRVSCSGWDTRPWDSAAWDNELCDDEEVIDGGGFTDGDDELPILSSGSFDENDNETFFIQPDDTFEFDESYSSYVVDTDLSNGDTYLLVNGEEFFNFTVNTDSVTRNHDDTIDTNTYEVGLPSNTGGNLEGVLVEVIDENGNIATLEVDVDYTISTNSNGDVIVELINPISSTDSIRFTFTYITFYSLSTGDIVEIFDNPPINAGHFNDPSDSSTSELMPIIGHDNVFFEVRETGVCPIGFTIYQSMTGVFSYWRTMFPESAVIAEPVSKDSDTIEIVSEGGVGLRSDVSVSDPGKIRINNEIILYHERNGNVLSSLIRGHDNTTIPEQHDSGETAWRLEDVDIPEPETYEWENDPDGTLNDSNTIQAEFLKEMCFDPLNMNDTNDDDYDPLNMENLL